MTPITYKERFVGNPKKGEAPTLIGYPGYIHVPNYKEFENNKEERKIKKEMKQEHRRSLKRAYPNGIGRHLNIPSKELSHSIKNSF